MSWLVKLLWALFGWGPPPGPAPAPAPAPTPTPVPAPPDPPAPAPDDVTLQLLRLHNEARAAHGARDLALCGYLTELAQAHAAWMAQNHQLTHNGGDGDLAARLKRVGYSYAEAGENVAEGQRNPAQALQSWLASPPHRANLLNPDYWHVGFGVADSDAGRFWSVAFAAPLRQALQQHRIKLSGPLQL